MITPLGLRLVHQNYEDEKNTVVFFEGQSPIGGGGELLCLCISCIGNFSTIVYR